MHKIEQSILDFISKWKLSIFIIVITFLAIITRISLIDVQSNDFNQFLLPWFETLHENGGIYALKNPIGDYNIPYLTIMALLTYLPIQPLYSIKLISIIFDFIVAIVASLMVKKILENSKYKHLFSTLTYAIVLFLPTVILNGSAWAQCDSIYTSFVLICLYFLLDKKYILSFIAYGIAFSFKLQAIFILPFLFILYVVRKKFSILYFTIIPIVNIILSMPALLMGYPFKNLLLIYLAMF